MKWQVVILAGLLLVVVLVAAINWQEFVAPASLNLVVRQVEAPLGAAMLGVVGLLTVLYVLFLAGARTSQLVETRKYAREAHEARQLANEVEASRFTELRKHLDEELSALREQLRQVEDSLASALDESHNSLVANLAEMDSRPSPVEPHEAGDEA